MSVWECAKVTLYKFELQGQKPAFGYVCLVKNEEWRYPRVPRKNHQSSASDWQILKYDW